MCSCADAYRGYDNCRFDAAHDYRRQRHNLQANTLKGPYLMTTNEVEGAIFLRTVPKILHLQTLKPLMFYSCSAMAPPNCSRRRYNNLQTRFQLTPFFFVA